MHVCSLNFFDIYFFVIVLNKSTLSTYLVVWGMSDLPKSNLPHSVAIIKTIETVG